MTDAPIIKDVWEDNFEQEFKIVMNLAERYKVVAMVSANIRKIPNNDLGYRIPRYSVQTQRK
jgi:hypothetical protein